MSDKTYRVVEIFATLQGEGANTGLPAIFVRFLGCNLWTGHDKHRERDADRHQAQCPRWCDTDFREAYKVGTAKEIALEVSDAMGPSKDNWIMVFTGGEPLLQLDVELVQAIQEECLCDYMALETNGTVELVPELREQLDWVCVSPKVHPSLLKVTRGDELKVVYPAYDPFDYEALDFGVKCVSPCATTSSVGMSLIDIDVQRRAAEFCMMNPEWRLSLQTHKILGLR